MKEQVKQRLTERLTERLTNIDEKLTTEQSKETPDSIRVNNLTQRKNRIQSKIDKFSE
jgi:capsule polysaccharide export protein KpsE/RkpR